MKDFYSRRQIMDLFSISRRVIEGYEKLNLISPDGKDEKGVLMYNRFTVRRIGFIRLCQKFGFSLSKVKEFIDLPCESIRNEFSKQTIKIYKEFNDRKNLLDAINMLIGDSTDPRENEAIFRLLRKEK